MPSDAPRPPLARVMPACLKERLLGAIEEEHHRGRELDGGVRHQDPGELQQYPDTGGTVRRTCGRRWSPVLTI